MNWIFSLQKSISKLILSGYTGSKNSAQNRLKIQFLELDFSKLIFQKSSTDQQGVWNAISHLGYQDKLILAFKSMEQTNEAEDVMVETTADANKGFKGLEIFG